MKPHNPSGPGIAVLVLLSVRFAARTFLASALALIACSAAHSQLICPVVNDFTNTSPVFNLTNPCVIESGVTFNNLGGSALLTNFSGASLLVDSGAALDVGLGAGIINNSMLTNNGRISDAGSILNGPTLAGGTLTNGGTLVTTVDGMLTNGGTLQGATLNNNLSATITNFGQFRNSENSSLNNSGILTNAGTLTNFLGTITNFFGTINNVGSFTNTGGTITNFIGIITNVATFNNAGTLNNVNSTLTNLGSFNNSAALNNSSTLDNAHSFINSGSVTNTGNLENSGFFSSNLLTNSSAGTVLNDSGATLSNSGTLTNAGTVSNHGTISNSGILNIQPGGVFNNLAGSTFTQTSGQLIVDGTLNSLTAVQIAGGVLSGTGTINGNVNNSGLVQPGDAPGTLTLNGNYSQGSFGLLTIDLGGTAPGDSSVLNVSGLSTLDGTLDLTAVNGFIPAAGDSFTFLLFGALSGDFSQIDFTNWSCPAGDTCTEIVGPHSLRLDVSAATSSTPEPSSILLLATGILALLPRSRNKIPRGVPR